MRTGISFAGFLLALYLPVEVAGQIPKQGFFLGGSFTALQMNGTGRIEEQNLDVTDKIIGNLEGEEIDLLTGFGFDDRILLGIQPVVGCRISPYFALIGAYNYYFQKGGESEDYFASGSELVTVTGTVKYSQQNFQLLSQVGKTVFIVTGLEFSFLSTEINFENSINARILPFDFIKSGVQTKGFVLGAGVEIPIQNFDRISFTGMALYSFAKYKGDEFIRLQGRNRSGATTPVVGLDSELKVGGISGNLGIRFYL